MPQESLESHDIDEMEMSDDDDSGSLRYGKRSRNDMKVRQLLFKSSRSSNEYGFLIDF